jgi:hypothetical protein
MSSAGDWLMTVRLTRERDQCKEAIVDVADASCACANTLSPNSAYHSHHHSTKGGLMRWVDMLLT